MDRVIGYSDTSIVSKTLLLVTKTTTSTDTR